MTFPLMPSTSFGYARGAVTVLGNADGTYNVGPATPHRWIVVASTLFSGSTFPAWSPPTVNGSSMTTIVQDISAFSNDGHQGAIWISQIPAGGTASVSGAPGFSVVFLMTGVRSQSVVVNTTGTVSSAPVGSFSVGYWVPNFGNMISVANMDVYGGFYEKVGYDLRMDSTPITYTPTHTGTLVLQRVVSWAFDY
jgi:hypothetical protein